jgi:hypothetical protein
VKVEKVPALSSPGYYFQNERLWHEPKRPELVCKNRTHVSITLTVNDPEKKDIDYLHVGDFSREGQFGLEGRWIVCHIEHFDEGEGWHYKWWFHEVFDE